MVEGARLEIVYVSKGASRVRIPLSPPPYSFRDFGVLLSYTKVQGHNVLWQLEYVRRAWWSISKLKI